MKLNVKELNHGIFHITDLNATHTSLLTKYNFLNNEISDFDPALLFSESQYVCEDEKVNFAFGKSCLTLSFSKKTKGYHLHIPIDKTTRFFGLGDCSRESIERRGQKLELWIEDFTGYGPIPFLMTTAGWGLFINSTYRICCDIDSQGCGALEFDITGGDADVYVFLAPSMKTILNLYTEITGKPIMLPKSSYGFVFVCNEEENARQLLEDSAAFRRNKIPCDVMSLEPEWMEKHYDFSTEKKWSSERFYLPPWHPENYAGHHSFFCNLREMGMKLSLWLCCDYDLLWEEEKTQLAVKEKAFIEDAEIRDEHLKYSVSMDKITVPGEPWFKHLEKFVEQGVFAFKMDGANQVLEHPDRLWAGAYTDDEVHNIYPLILAKQMKEGFEKKTGKRAMIFTPGIYAGTQKYAATWSGDTGGQQETLVSIMNHALCGHTNATCDINLTDPASIHYGSLISWSEGFAWCNWNYPWLLGDRLCGIIQDYNTLRSSLFPYIYSYAHEAAQSGMPIARPLPLVYENTDKFDKTENMYMLGDAFLVGAFDMHMDLPEGKWTDYFTGEVYEGKFEYCPPEGKGGALFVKAGSIVVTQPPMLYLEEKIPEYYHVDFYPGEACSFDLIEDDGTTYEYLNNAFCSTHIQMDASDGKALHISIGQRTGHFSEMPDVTDLHLCVHHAAKPKKLTLNDSKSDFTYCAEGKLLCFTVKAETRQSGDIAIDIEF